MKEPYRPLTASITGIDGAGKSSVSTIVTNQLPCDVRIAKISRPVYSVTDGKTQPKYTRMMGVVDMVHAFADEKRSKNLSLAANAIDVVAQGRIIEPGLIRNVRPQLVLGTRDYLIDPSVYASYYSKFLSGRSMETRLDFFKRLTGSSIRDVIFFLTVPPDEAVARIDRRILDEAGGETNPARLKWKHMHEREDHLTMLQSQYHIALDILRKREKPAIYHIDTSKYTKEQVADQITSTLETHLAKQSAV